MIPKAGKGAGPRARGGPAVRVGESPQANEILVIGIGNEYACDDAAGLLVVRNLKNEMSSHVTIIESGGDGASLIEAWRGATSAIVIDAVRSGAAPGRAHRFDASQRPLPAQPFRGSTHAFGLYEAVELARSLNELPRRLIVYGIEGGNFEAGCDISGHIAQSVREVTASVWNEIIELQRLEVA